MVKLLLKWPNLYYSTSAFAPKHYPEDIINFANTRGADKIIYAGYYSAGLGLDRIFSELPNVPFRDHVWPKFLRENAARVFKPRGSAVTDNAAFDAALAAGGAIDTSVGVPKTREEMFAFYGFIRDQAKDAESQEGRRRARDAGGLHVQGAARLGRRRARRPGRVPHRRARPSRHPPGDRLGRGSGGRPRRARAPRPLLRVDRRQPEPRHGSGAQDRALRRRVRPEVRRGVPRGPEPAGRGGRQEVVPDLHEVRRARHPVRVDDGRAGAAHPVLTAGRRRASTRSAGTSPS